MNLIPAFLRSTAEERMTNRILLGRKGRPGWAPVAPAPRRDPFDGVALGDGLPAREWMDARDVSVSPLDAEAAADVMEASLGSPWTGAADASASVRIALAVLAEAGGHVAGGRGRAAVDALLRGDRDGGAALADAALSGPQAAAFVSGAAAGHGFTGTVLCSALAAVLPLGRVGLSDLAYLKALDRAAWFGLVAVAGGAPQPEGWAVLDHYAAEKRAGRALASPVLRDALARIIRACEEA